MRKKTKTITETEETFYIDTQTSYSGKLRWLKDKPTYDGVYNEPILQQEVVIRSYINGIIQNVETEWVNVPVEIV